MAETVDGRCDLQSGKGRRRIPHRQLSFGWTQVLRRTDPPILLL